MVKTVEIQLGHHRGPGLYDVNGIACNRGDTVILEVERGSEFGRVISNTQNLCETKAENVKGKLLRPATEGDLKQIDNNEMKAKDARNACMRKITERKLDMHITDVEYTFDSSKVIFYFTADGRVDFRNLVKDLARVFRVRIELKQIGVRDKAKIIGGYGVCGRALCCSSYMKDFHALSIKMAKTQGLPLNPSRISGVCGRIKCCMSYEYEVYKVFSRNLPKVGDKLTLADAKGKVIDVNILKKFVTVEAEDGRLIKSVYT